eukprot:428294-Rhodomonas_salina.2
MLSIPCLRPLGKVLHSLAVPLPFFTLHTLCKLDSSAKSNTREESNADAGDKECKYAEEKQNEVEGVKLSKVEKHSLSLLFLCDQQWCGRSCCSLLLTVLNEALETFRKALVAREAFDARQASSGVTK